MITRTTPPNLSQWLPETRIPESMKNLRISMKLLVQFLKFLGLPLINWGPWNSWSKCSFDCEPGESQGRSRICIDKTSVAKSNDLKPCILQVSML